MAQAITYYDSSLGANLILLTPNANTSDVLHDLELDSRRSFYFLDEGVVCDDGLHSQ